MQLAVTGGDAAVRREQKRTVGGLGVADLDRQRTDQQPDLQFLGQRRKNRQRRVMRLVKGLCQLGGTVRVVFSGVAMKAAPWAAASRTSLTVSRIFSATSSLERSCTHAARNAVI